MQLLIAGFCDIEIASGRTMNEIAKSQNLKITKFKLKYVE